MAARRCPECGKFVPRAASFCPSCAAELPSVESRLFGLGFRHWLFAAVVAVLGVLVVRELPPWLLVLVALAALAFGLDHLLERGRKSYSRIAVGISGLIFVVLMALAIAAGPGAPSPTTTLTAPLSSSTTLGATTSTSTTLASSVSTTLKPTTTRVPTSTTVATIVTTLKPTTTTTRATTTTVARTTTATDEEIIVHITRTGAKYHRGGCSYLRQSDIPVSLSKAKERGYDP